MVLLSTCDIFVCFIFYLIFTMPTSMSDFADMYCKVVCCLEYFFMKYMHNFLLLSLSTVLGYLTLLEIYWNYF